VRTRRARPWLAHVGLGDRHTVLAISPPILAHGGVEQIVPRIHALAPFHAAT